MAQVLPGQLGLLGHLVRKGRPVHLDLEETRELLALQVKEEMLDLRDLQVLLDSKDLWGQLVLQVQREQLVMLVHRDLQALLVHKDLKETREILAQLDRLDHQEQGVHLDQLVPKVTRVQQVLQDPQALQAHLGLVDLREHQD